jgi:cyanophycinase
MGTLISLLLLILPIFSPCAAKQSAANSRAVRRSNAHFHYWRIGNSKDVHTMTRGGFALIGGGKDLDVAFTWLCKQSGGGNFLVLRATGTDAYNPYIQKLCHENSIATLLIPNRRAAFDPAVRKRIAAAQAIFISGGDQAKYINYWRNTPVQRALNDAIRRGVPVGGTSAGLAVQGQFVYSAQEDPEEGPDLDSATTLQNPYLPRVTIVRKFLDIPPLRDTITDTHFSRRDRMGRLLVFMARILQSGDVKSIRGIAVDEHTAVLLTPNGQGTVVGTGAVYFLRASSKAAVCQSGVPLTFGAISVIKVNAGGEFDTATWSGSGTHYELAVEKGSIHSTQAKGEIY